MNSYTIDSFLAYTLGIIVFFVGVLLTKQSQFLRHYNIPEAVTGGMLAAISFYLLYILTGLEVSFDLSARDQLLVYFFTAIGINARVSDLLKGGKPLLMLTFLTLVFILLQNVIGIASAQALGLPNIMGVITGSASLIGGHGTAIAWAGQFEQLGVEKALEIGIAAATLGLVLASLVGGPIAQYLMKKHQLSGRENIKPVVGLHYDHAPEDAINHINFMTVILVLHLCIIVGYIVNQVLLSHDIKLPLFVSCLMCGILFSNTLPHFFPKMPWPARTRSLAIVSDFSLSLFLAMSLMSMQLWAIADLATPLLAILGAQLLGAVVFIIYILFPLMGRNYQAAVLSAGFGGFALGATPTAIANMTAVTKSHGQAPTALIILPLVAAFFVDLANAFVIGFIAQVQ
jgi:ESS family glutamate:Na+ symporter